MADWSSPADVRRTYGSASFVGERVVVNIAGNKYRLITLIDYRRHGVLIRWVGTHQEYDRIDVRSI
jgi:mRNA interferase HigB